MDSFAIIRQPEINKTELFVTGKQGEMIIQLSNEQLLKLAKDALNAYKIQETP